MFIVCVKEADLGMMAFVACSAPWLSEWYTMSFHVYHAQCTLVQVTLGVGAVNFWLFTVAWPREVGVSTCPLPPQWPRGIVHCYVLLIPGFGGGICNPSDHCVSTHPVPLDMDEPHLL